MRLQRAGLGHTLCVRLAKARLLARNDPGQAHKRLYHP
jgi:hypothetical protein